MRRICAVMGCETRCDTNILMRDASRLNRPKPLASTSSQQARVSRLAGLLLRNGLETHARFAHVDNCLSGKCGKSDVVYGTVLVLAAAIQCQHIAHCLTSTEVGPNPTLPSSAVQVRQPFHWRNTLRGFHLDASGNFSAGWTSEGPEQLEHVPIDPCFGGTSPKWVAWPFRKQR